jgi:hypothetical protein
MRFRKPFSAAKSIFAIFTTLLLAAVVVPIQSQAQKFKVLHTFHGPNGNGPAGVLTRDSAGNLHGTTEAGGTGKCGTFGCGTAFKLNRSGKQVWLPASTLSTGKSPLLGCSRCNRESGYLPPSQLCGLMAHGITSRALPHFGAVASSGRTLRR